MYEKLEECPICLHSNFKPEFICKDHLVSGESFAVCSCLHCGLLMTNPRPDEKSIGQYYQSEQYLSHNDNGSILSRFYYLAQQYTLWYKHNLLKKLNAPDKTLLDFGCGSGSFLRHMSRHKWHVTGIEPSPNALQKASSFGIEVFPSIEDLLNREIKFDIITLWHVLEHVHNLNDTIKSLRKLLVKHGHIVVAVPNPNSWDALHYRSDWAAYDVPRHLYHFSERNITSLLKNHKFNFIDKHPLYLDSFYISLLSERNKPKTSKLAFLSNGLKSNISATKTKEFSSMIYIFQKK